VNPTNIRILFHERFCLRAGSIKHPHRPLAASLKESFMKPKFVLIRSSSTQTIVVTACVCLVSGLLGCGSGGPTRIALSGKVTQGGAPVAKGAISLVPAPGRG